MLRRTDVCCGSFMAVKLQYAYGFLADWQRGQDGESITAAQDGWWVLFLVGSFILVSVSVTVVNNFSHQFLSTVLLTNALWTIHVGLKMTYTECACIVMRWTDGVNNNGNMKYRLISSVIFRMLNRRACVWVLLSSSSFRWKLVYFRQMRFWFSSSLTKSCSWPTTVDRWGPRCVAERTFKLSYELVKISLSLRKINLNKCKDDDQFQTNSGKVIANSAWTDFVGVLDHLTRSTALG